MPQDDLDQAPSAAPAEAPVTDEALQSQVQQDAEAPELSQEQAQGDSPSSSTPEDSEKSLLDGVSDVLKQKAETPQTQEAEEAGSEKPDSTKTATEGQKKEGQQEAVKEDDGKDDHKLPFHKHPRFQQIVRQRREALKEAEEFKRQLETLKPLEEKAKQFDNIGSFLVQNDLTNDEFIQGVQIMAAMKNNPLQAMEMLRPHIEALQKVTGEILPPDIQAKVESGEVDTATAKELVQTRVKLAVEHEQRQKVVQQTQAQQVQAVVAANQSAVLAWEQKIKQSDPDYAAKAQLVYQLVAARQQTSPARSPEEAVAFAQQSYEQVSAALPKPKLVATRPTPSSAASLPASQQQHAKPKSIYEGVDGALRGLRSGA